MNETLKLIAQLGAGVASLYFVLQILKVLLPAFGKKGENGNKRAETSGDKPPEYWREVFREITEEAVHNAFASRNEELRRLIREEMARRKT